MSIGVISTICIVQSTIYQQIAKYEIDDEVNQLLAKGHEEIKQSECYQEYGLPMYIYRIEK